MDLIITLIIWGFFICVAIWLFQIFLALIITAMEIVIFLVTAPFVWIYNKLKEGSRDN